MFVKSIDFSRYSSIKIGPAAEVLMLEKGEAVPAGRFLVGGANNLLISPTPPPLMMLSKDFDYCRIEEDFLEIGAATPTGKILSFAKKHDLAGFEFVAKLPGTLGGMLAMNAGVKEYEIFPLLDSVEIEGRWIPAGKIEHGYRYAKLPGIATAARFPLRQGYDETLRRSLLRLRENQPKEPSAGSAFKNPPGDYAGRLIEAVGLKGYRQGDMAWSEIHANFLVNLGGGTFDEATELINLAKERVRERFGIELEEEIKILDISVIGQ
ncbi:UDP-N-acetylmuramate dehydrogenase [Nitratifractor salsuginis]|uniref:UDP-N-acetylenolpyruvoylglucosamine reductase n=1 Tax=Nitratifractor salsuginis (strain DSM 16511 / JCM 12458 / E9I37-1) TaxID=749222 RepID=E6WZ17_NITSE|nr:UDP-N-acetylmuramate dehydrogenase [Nitratifractor salsuginis]ADV45467.1 UDP-N-acetylenolpyruvoylglucosamine reductase [Nitratifractor salsuginis DSM 16511]